MLLGLVIGLLYAVQMQGMATGNEKSLSALIAQEGYTFFSNPLDQSSAPIFADYSVLNRHRGQKDEFRVTRLKIDADWPARLYKPDTSYIISRGLLGTWNPWKICASNLGHVYPVICDIRYMHLKTDDIGALEEHPPHPRTRVIVNTRAIMDRSESHCEQLTNAQVARINAAWQQHAAQYDRRCYAQKVVDALYNYRYFLAGAVVAYSGYRYMQSNHTTWISQRLAERELATATIEALKAQITQMKTIIAQTRSGLTSYTAHQIANAFDNLHAVQDCLGDKKSELLDLPVWTIWSSVLKVIKDKCCLLMGSLAMVWLVDTFIARKLLAYAPFEPPCIEVRNDIRAYECSLLRHFMNGGTYYTYSPGAYTCCAYPFGYNGGPHFMATLTDEQKATFERNRTIAKGVAAVALGAGSLYVMRLLYRHADKLRSLLSK
jgi:hypothetical protein